MKSTIVLTLVLTLNVDFGSFQIPWTSAKLEEFIEKLIIIIKKKLIYDRIVLL